MAHTVYLQHACSAQVCSMKTELGFVPQMAHKESEASYMPAWCQCAAKGTSEHIQSDLFLCTCTVRSYITHPAQFLQVQLVLRPAAPSSFEGTVAPVANRMTTPPWQSQSDAPRMTIPERHPPSDAPRVTHPE
eukprot:scaffold124378_cov18-Tisochrysis_lutea.AAC.1